MRFAPLVLAGICVLVLFTGLDRIGLVDEREARDAEVARELIAEHEPLTPLYGFTPLYEKPLLAYAPEVIARLSPSVPDTRSRQIRALLTVLLLVITASVGAEHFGARAGWFSAIVLATSLVVPVAARADGTQVLASLLGWAGCAGLADAVFGRSAGREMRLVVAYGALAAAFVCAGPLPALWPLGGLALYLALARTPDGWRRARPLAGLGVVLGLALPWYGAMIERHGGAFLERFAFFPYGAGERGLWYVGPSLPVSFFVVGFFPWITLLPGAVVHAATWWRMPRIGSPRAAGSELPRSDPVAREHREESAAHFFVACLLAALVPLAIYPGPPLPAVLPALPAAALLCGRFLDHLFEDPRRVAGALGRAVGMLALLGSVGGILLVLVAGRIREASHALRLLGTLVFLASWAPLLANLLGRHRVAAALVTLPVVVGTPVVVMRLLPAMESYLNAREVADAMASVSPPRAALVLIEPAPPSLRLYTRRNLVTGSELGPALERNRAADGFSYMAFRPARERDVARTASVPLEILVRTPSMVLARVRRE